jgi:5'-nucleotidase
MACVLVQLNYYRNKSMPNILITNDDGFQAPALAALARHLAALGRVTVFAPDHNWSAAGHTRTMHKPLRVTESRLADGTPLYCTTGTPSDCVGLALLGVLPERPDLVVSGINQGSNVGHDITYSGTVAAAMEGTIAEIPSLAVSQDTDGEPTWDLEFAARSVAELARQVLARGLPPKVLLNVNFPALPPDQIRGVQITRLGRRIYRDTLIRRLDPRGMPYYWLGGGTPTGEPEAGTDLGALEAGYVSVTPLNMDMTDRALMAEMIGWNLALTA